MDLDNDTVRSINESEDAMTRSYEKELISNRKYNIAKATDTKLKVPPKRHEIDIQKDEPVTEEMLSSVLGNISKLFRDKKRVGLTHL
jgi:hypothetical protein